MISINNVPFEWEKGMTLENAVRMALSCKQFAHLNEGQLIYMLNSRMIMLGRLDKTIVEDNDRIHVFPIAIGG